MHWLRHVYKFHSFLWQTFRLREKSMCGKYLRLCRCPYLQHQAWLLCNELLQFVCVLLLGSVFWWSLRVVQGGIVPISYLHINSSGMRFNYILLWLFTWKQGCTPACVYGTCTNAVCKCNTGYLVATVQFNYFPMTIIDIQAQIVAAVILAT